MKTAQATAPQEVPTYRPLPTTTLKVHCGCGASFDNTSEGALHAHTYGHTLTISGEIRVSK